MSLPGYEVRQAVLPPNEAAQNLAKGGLGQPVLDIHPRDRALMTRSVRGSKPFTHREICRGYRDLKGV